MAPGTITDWTGVEEYNVSCGRLKFNFISPEGAAGVENARRRVVVEVCVIIRRRDCIFVYLLLILFSNRGRKSYGWSC